RAAGAPHLCARSARPALSNGIRLSRTPRHSPVHRVALSEDPVERLEYQWLCLTVVRNASGPNMTNKRHAALPLGPGLITGACNNDPSSVGTYSQVGAQFGFGLAWTLPFSFPLLVAIQEISARIARVTGHGIAGNLRRHTPGWLAATLVLLLAIANVFNLAADLGAMSAVLRL